MSRLPLVAISGSVEDHAGEADLTVPMPYLEALERADALPAVLHAVKLAPGAAVDLLDPFAGLVLTGGGDVDPSFYNQPPGPELYGVDAVRDAFEIELLRAAIARRLPVLAICRGLQVLDIAYGGTLDQHITGKAGLEGHGIPHGGPRAVHAVRLDPESALAEVMGVREATISCHHHQAIVTVGEGLKPVAWTGDGLVEGVETADGSVIAVQWHPEDTAAGDPAQQRLFDALVKQAATAGAAR